jgi:hypothetical protein
MKKIKNRLKTIFGKTKGPFKTKTTKLTKADVDDIKSAMTEIELRDR